jgi:hypothetical protein
MESGIAAEMPAQTSRRAQAARFVYAATAVDDPHMPVGRLKQFARCVGYADHIIFCFASACSL